LGTTGSLNYSDTAEIINKYLNKPGSAPVVDVNHTLNLKNLNQLVQKHLQPAERFKLAN
jgi:LEA14-like dessication related protein